MQKNQSISTGNTNTLTGRTKGTAFAIQGEAGLQLRLRDNLGLGLFANYLTSKPTFDFVRSDVTGSPTSSVVTTTRIKNFSATPAW